MTQSLENSEQRFAHGDVEQTRHNPKGGDSGEAIQPVLARPTRLPGVISPQLVDGVIRRFVRWPGRSRNARSLRKSRLAGHVSQQFVFRRYGRDVNADYSSFAVPNFVHHPLSSMEALRIQRRRQVLSGGATSASSPDLIRFGSSMIPHPASIGDRPAPVSHQSSNRVLQQYADHSSVSNIRPHGQLMAQAVYARPPGRDSVFRAPPWQRSVPGGSAARTVHSTMWRGQASVQRATARAEALQTAQEPRFIAPVRTFGSPATPAIAGRPSTTYAPYSEVPVRSAGRFTRVQKSEDMAGSPEQPAGAAAMAASTGEATRDVGRTLPILSGADKVDRPIGVVMQRYGAKAASPSRQQGRFDRPVARVRDVGSAASLQKAAVTVPAGSQTARSIPLPVASASGRSVRGMSHTPHPIWGGMKAGGLADTVMQRYGAKSASPSRPRGRFDRPVARVRDVGPAASLQKAAVTVPTGSQTARSIPLPVASASGRSDRGMSHTPHPILGGMKAGGLADTVVQRYGARSASPSRQQGRLDQPVIRVSGAGPAASLQKAAVAVPAGSRTAPSIPPVATSSPDRSIVQLRRTSQPEQRAESAQSGEQAVATAGRIVNRPMPPVQRLVGGGAGIARTADGVGRRFLMDASDRSAKLGLTRPFASSVQRSSSGENLAFPLQAAKLSHSGTNTPVQRKTVFADLPFAAADRGKRVSTAGSSTGHRTDNGYSLSTGRSTWGGSDLSAPSATMLQRVPASESSPETITSPLATDARAAEYGGGSFASLQADELALDQIADKVYRIIEQRLIIERESRGL